MLITEIPTADGRVFKSVNPRLFRCTMKDGKIVSYTCPKHGKQDISEVYLWKVQKDGVERTQFRCKECDYDRWDRKRQKIGPRTPNKHSLQEYRRYEVDGVMGKDCLKCGKWKASVEFSLNKCKRPRAEGALYGICKECRGEITRSHHYLRLIRKKFPVDSPEFRFSETEKRSYHLQALCWLSYFFVDRKLPTEKRERLSPTLRRVRDDETTTLEQKVEEIVPLLQKR